MHCLTAKQDACLEQDPNSKVACETASKTGMIMVFGEISTKAQLDYQKVIRETIKKIGYDSSEKGFDYKTCKRARRHRAAVADIAQGLDHGSLEEHGAGDQGIMFGYATDETPELIALTLMLSHKLNLAMSAARRDGTLGWLRPDSKTQVTVEYKKDGGATIPLRVDTVVISTQHARRSRPRTSDPKSWRRSSRRSSPRTCSTTDTSTTSSPRDVFVIGGPQGDAGLTGRKIIVDTTVDGCPRRWCFLRKGLLQGRPIRCLQPLVGSPSRSSLLASPAVSWCSSRTPSVSLTLFRSSSTRTAR